MDTIPAANIPYATIADVRAAGITDGQADDLTVQALLNLYTSFIDRRTRQWFNRRDLTVRVEGRNSNLLQLGVPIIQVTSLRANHHLPTSPGEILDLNRVEVFTARTYPDYRRNPMIKIIANRGSIYGSYGRSFRRGMFTDIVGSFGFLEPDGSTPPEIKRALVKLVIIAINNPIANANGNATGPVASETTDIHSISYFKPVDEELESRVGTASGDKEVDEILKAYRAPIAIGGSILDMPVIDDGVTQ